MGRPFVWIVVMAFAALVAWGGADPFAGAKWIGGNAVTCPDYDFGAARWIAAKEGGTPVFERRFVLAEKPETAELVVAARDRFFVEVNGRKRWGEAARDLAPTGAFHDSRYAKFVEIGRASCRERV